MKSKTKTFEADTDFSDVVQWVCGLIETNDHEVITNTDYDVQVRTVKKYKITVTEME